MLSHTRHINITTYSLSVKKFFRYFCRNFRVNFVIPYHQLTRAHTVLTGRKTPMLLQSPWQYTKYYLQAFHCLNAFLLRQNCLHLTVMDFYVIFGFWDADGLTPVKVKRTKSTGKTRCQACVLLSIDGINLRAAFVRLRSACIFFPAVIRSARTFLDLSLEVCLYL